MESDIKELKEKIYWRIKDRKADYKSADDLESIYKELEEIISMNVMRFGGTFTTEPVNKKGI